MKNMNDSMNILLSAKKSFIISMITMLMVIGSIIIFFVFQKNVNDAILKKISERDILVLTNSGVITGKTTSDFKIIAKQFALVTFASTLNYDPVDIIPQLNFMRVYSTNKIFNNYKKMVQTTSSNVKLEHKIYHAAIDTNKKIVIKTIIPNQKYEIEIYGKRQIISNYTSKDKEILLSITIEKDINTTIKNIFGLKITRYNLDEI